MKNKILLISIIGLYFCSKALGQIPSNLKYIVDSLFEEHIQAHSFVPGHTLHLYKPGQWEYTTSVGLSRIEDQTVMKDHMLFKQASITKLFTSSVIMQLIEEGKVSLSDYITKYLTPTQLQYFLFKDQIKVEHLLQHTSGLIDPQWDFQGPMNRWIYCKPNDNIPVDSLLMWSSGGLDLNVHRYSNTNYVILALIIEAVTGKTYHESITERIIEPLNLQNTKFEISPTDLVMNGYVGSSFFPGACYQENDSLFNFTYASNSWGFGSADLWSNTQNLIQYLKAWKENQIFNSSVKDLQLSPFIRAGDRAYIANGIFKYTLPDDPETYAYGHSGSAFGYGSELRYIPVLDLYMCGASNFMKVGYGFLMEKLYLALKDKLISSNEDIFNENITIVPNPFNHTLSIKTENNTSYKYTLSDVNGSLLIISNDGNFDTSKLKSGIYFISIFGNLHVKTYKCVKY